MKSIDLKGGTRISDFGRQDEQIFEEMLEQPDIDDMSLHRTQREAHLDSLPRIPILVEFGLSRFLFP